MHILLFFINLFFLSQIQTNQETITPNAFCSVPVADLIGAPIRTFFSIEQATTQELYERIPYSETRRSHGSPRIAQLLFNQAVEILAIKGDEVKIKVPDMYYGDGTKMYNTYWTQSSCITPLTKPLVKGVPLPHTKTVILTCALTHPMQKMTYSAGTCFVKTGKQKRTSLECFYYNSTTKTIETLWIKKDSLRTCQPPKKEIRKAFIVLLKTWAHQKNGFIPYVFGGCSIGKPLKNNTFFEKHITFTKKPCTFFERPDAPTPRIGIDCARLFARAFQTLNITWSALNSKAFKMQLRSLHSYEKPQIGDFIYFSGHIAVISDVKKGLLIEARSYQDGYGKVHEIPFSEQFQNIHTIKDLQHAAQTKKRVVRLNNSGKKSQSIDDLEILKFPDQYQSSSLPIIFIFY